MFILENKYGNDGYAVWFKTLEILGANENHFFDCRNIEEWEFLLAKYKVNEDTATAILNTAAKLSAIHHELWENKIIWSCNFIEGLENVYKRRESSCMHFDDICKHLLIKCKHKYNSNGVIVDKKPQSRVKESKAEESKVIIPFDDEKFIQVWDFWKKYKKEQFNFTHKPIGEQGALSKLYELSGKDVGKAMLIIKQSIQNGWVGLFELKGEFKNKEYDREKIFNDLRC